MPCGACGCVVLWWSVLWVRVVLLGAAGGGGAGVRKREEPLCLCADDFAHLRAWAAAAHCPSDVSKSALIAATQGQLSPCCSPLGLFIYVLCRAHPQANRAVSVCTV